MKLVRITFLVSFVLSLSIVGKGQSYEQKPDGNYTVNFKCGVPYELVVLATSLRGVHLYVLANEQNLTERELTPFFRCLIKTYPGYTWYSITLFTDRNNLSVAIRNHFVPLADSNPPDDTSTTDCANWRVAVRPCPVGYFRVSYYYSEKSESYLFGVSGQTGPKTGNSETTMMGRASFKPCFHSRRIRSGG